MVTSNKLLFTQSLRGASKAFLFVANDSKSTLQWLDYEKHPERYRWESVQWECNYNCHVWCERWIEHLTTSDEDVPDNLVPTWFRDKFIETYVSPFKAV